MSAARILAALLGGMAFGLGLALSGMLDPLRVQGFLDVAGEWDPTLAFVLGAAVAVAFPAVQFARRLPRPLLDEAFDLPVTHRIDARLVVGSALFGIGWGVSGFCPGPAVAAMALGLWQPMLFVVAMLVGIGGHDRLIARAGR